MSAVNPSACEGHHARALGSAPRHRSEPAARWFCGRFPSTAVWQPMDDGMFGLKPLRSRGGRLYQGDLMQVGTGALEALCGPAAMHVVDATSLDSAVTPA